MAIWCLSGVVFSLGVYTTGLCVFRGWMKHSCGEIVDESKALVYSRRVPIGDFR